MMHPALGEVNDLVHRPPQYFPGPFPDPFVTPDYPPYLPPRGRWVWIPEDDGLCDACRRGGVCGCVRPGRWPVVYASGGAPVGVVTVTHETSSATLTIQ